MATPIYWAFCCHADAVGRWARGFVLATSKKEATAKARKRVKKERRNLARTAGLPRTELPRRGVHALRVWPDPNRLTAPRAARHYVERRTA